jgi:hypothetical protein
MLVLDRARSNSLNFRIPDWNGAAIAIVRHTQTASKPASHVPSPRASTRCIDCPPLLPLARGTQIPIACGTSLPDRARFRPLQLFGRRPRACGTAFMGPASEKLNICVGSDRYGPEPTSAVLPKSDVNLGRQTIPLYSPPHISARWPRRSSHLISSTSARLGRQKASLRSCLWRAARAEMVTVLQSHRPGSRRWKQAGPRCGPCAQDGQSREVPAAG